MKITYKVVGWEYGTGLATIEASCVAHPTGTRFGLSLMNEDGTYYSTEEALSRIEAALPVAWFEQLAKQQAANADDAHIRALLIAPARSCDKTAMDQGQLRPVVL